MSRKKIIVSYLYGEDQVQRVQHRHPFDVVVHESGESSLGSAHGGDVRHSPGEDEQCHHGQVAYDANGGDGGDQVHVDDLLGEGVGVVRGGLARTVDTEGVLGRRRRTESSQARGGIGAVQHGRKIV